MHYWIEAGLVYVGITSSVFFNSNKDLSQVTLKSFSRAVIWPVTLVAALISESLEIIENTRKSKE